MIRLAKNDLFSHSNQVKIYMYSGLGCTVKNYCESRPNIPEDQKQRLPLISAMKNSNKNVNSPPTAPVSDDTTFIQFVVKYVEKTTYMDEVRRAQAKVMDIKKQLVKAADEKRSLTQNVENIRNDLQLLYNDMKIHRTKEAYLDLARKEIKLCEKEKSFTEMYKIADIKEQTLFSDFSTAINDSYEKEKLHTNFIKVISIIGTITTSLLALIISVLFHAFHYSKSRNDKPYSDDALKSIKDRLMSIEKAVQKKESWGSYLHQHTRWVYSWAIGSK